MTLDKLQNCRYIAVEVDTLQERIARLRSAMERITPVPDDGSGVHVAPDADKLAAQMAKLMELEEQLRNRVIFLEDELVEAEARLTVLPEQQQVVMRLRYLRGLTWREIARKLHYSQSHCKNIAAAADKRLYDNFSIFTR